MTDTTISFFSEALWSFRRAAERYLKVVFVSAPKEQKAFSPIDWNNQPGILLVVPPWTADKNLSILAFVRLPKFPLWYKTMCWLFVLQTIQKLAKEPISLGCHQWETHFFCSMHLAMQTTEKRGLIICLSWRIKYTWTLGQCWNRNEKQNEKGY